MTARAVEVGPLRGWHVLTAMIAFFTLVIAVNIAFAVIAVRTFPGEDVQRSYLQGLHYNQLLADRARERALGWKVAADFVGAGAHPALTVDLAYSGGAPMTDATVTATLRRPATDREDRTLTLQHIGDGRYRADAGALAPGVWSLKAVAIRNGQELHFDRTLTWRSTR